MSVVSQYIEIKGATSNNMKGSRSHFGKHLRLCPHVAGLKISKFRFQQNSPGNTLKLEMLLKIIKLLQAN